MIQLSIKDVKTNISHYAKNIEKKNPKGNSLKILLLKGNIQCENPFYSLFTSHIRTSRKS